MFPIMHMQINKVIKNSNFAQQIKYLNLFAFKSIFMPLLQMTNRIDLF